MNPDRIPDESLPKTGLRSKIRALGTGFYRPGEAVYAPWELLIMRLCFAWVVWQTLPLNGHFRGQPQPNGLAIFFDLTWIGAASAKAWLQPVFWVALGIYALGLAPLLSTVTLFTVHCLYHTLHNSQGAIGHSAQIVSLVLLGQALAHLYDWIGAARGAGPLNLGERLAAPWRHLGQWMTRPLRLFRPDQGPLEDWARQARGREIFLSQQMIALAYVVSGLAKLLASEGKWIKNLPNIALQMVKTQRQDYYTDLIAPAAGFSQSVLGFIIAHPNWSRLFFSGGLILEVFCFVALFNRGIMALWGLGLITMHFMIGLLMALDFDNNVQALWIYFVNAPFWIAALGLWGWRRSRAGTSHARLPEPASPPLTPVSAPTREAA